MDEITLNNLFKNIYPIPDNPYEKVLTFYRMIIELERMKEPDIKEYFDYPLHYDEKTKKYNVLLSENESFLQRFDDNKNSKITKFPSDLYFGLQMLINGQAYRLLNTVVDFKDFISLQTEDSYDVRFSNFEVNLKEAARLELLPEKIDSINEKITEVENLDDVLNLLKTEIDSNAALDSKIYLALSNKSITLSQIYSELNDKKHWENLGKNKDGLLESFLLNDSISNQVDSVDTDSLIQITQLDESQKEAIALALNSKLSVITGAPGTGKTQVIENLMANAIIRKKKVLVASKNNKAVDNVKDRFAEFDKTGYFLRFGTKEYTSTKTIPVLNAMYSAIALLKDNTTEYESCTKEYSKAIRDIRNGNKNLAYIPKLKSEIEQLAKQREVAYNHWKSLEEEFEHRMAKMENDYNQKIKSIDEGYQQEIDSIEQSHKNNLAIIERDHKTKIDTIEAEYKDYLELDNLQYEELNQYLIKLNKIEYRFERKFNGIFSFWHRKFGIRKNAILLLETINIFPYIIKKISGTKNAYTKLSDFKRKDDLFAQLYIWNDIINKGIGYKIEYSSVQNEYIQLTNNTIETYTTQNLKTEKEYLSLKNKTKSNYDKNKQKTVLEYNKSIESAKSKHSKIKEKECDCRLELQKFETNIPKYQKQIEKGKLWIENNALKMLTEYIHYFKTHNSIANIHDYMQYLPPNQTPWQDSVYIKFRQSAQNFTDLFKVCAVTSLSTKNAFPLMRDLFDMVIIDEASQCDIASALPLILRTKQLVVIGDPMQLKHITAITPDEEQLIKEKLSLANCVYLKYANSSLYDYCNALISKAKDGNKASFMLKYHYRCHNDIIRYSNDMFYGGTMKNPLIVKTDLSNLKGGEPKGIVLVDVKGMQKNPNININEEEVKKSLELAIENAKQYKDITIGIITPFKHQSERINYMIPSEYRNRIEASTVHKFQGDEKDIIIYSLVITDNSFAGKIYWIDRVVPNLVNVAVTRAKSRLYVVGNIDYIRRNSNNSCPLGYLIQCGQK